MTKGDEAIDISQLEYNNGFFIEKKVASATLKPECFTVDIKVLQSTVGFFYFRSFSQGQLPLFYILDN